LEPSTAIAMISPAHANGHEPYRDARIGASGFLTELSHELWSASHQLFEAPVGCPTNSYCEAFIRLSGLRTTIPRESRPSAEPEALAYLPFPIETCPDQYGSRFVTRDHVFVARSKTAPPLPPQLC